MSAEGYGVSLAGAAFGADLGSSSKHSAEKPFLVLRGPVRRRVSRQLRLNESESVLSPGQTPAHVSK